MSMPKYYEDYAYHRYIADWYFSQGITDITDGGNIAKAGIPLDGIEQTWIVRGQDDNIRLGNLLDVLILLLPKWVGGLIAALCWLFSMLLSFKIANIDIGKSSMVSFAIAAWGIFLPWMSHIGCQIFQFNYIVPTFLSLSIVYLTTKMATDTGSILKINTNSKSLLKYFSLFLLGILTGWWHEGFSLPLICGLVALILFYKDMRRFDVIAAIIGLILGVLIVIASPGTGARLSNTSAESVSLKNIILYNIPYYIFIAICIAALFRKGLKFIKDNKIIIFCVISGLIPILISLLTFSQARVTWWSIIISTVGMIKILPTLWPRLCGKYSVVNLLCLTPVVLLLFIRFTVTDIYAFKLRNMMSQAISIYETNPDTTLYSQLITSKDFPLITGNLPDVLLPSDMFVIADFLSVKSGKTNFKIIPEELRDVTALSGREVSKTGVREYRGRLFLATDSIDYNDYAMIIIDADYGHGFKPVRTYPYHFTSESDGNTYLYLNMIEPWPESHLFPIREVRLPKHQ